MATQSELIKNYSGIFGNMVVLKNRKGKIVLTVPRPRRKTAPTANQAAMRQRFKNATLYASGAMKDPALRAFYEGKGGTAKPPYLVALADFLKPPIIRMVDASAFKGNINDRIRITIGDGCRIVSVTLRISDSSGKLLEEGECQLSLPSGTYDYIVKEKFESFAGFVICACATDLPGNVTEKSITL